MKLAALPISLRQLQYFVAVAGALSFRKAAAQCHVSQPSLSAQLAQLEEALGTRLLERDTKHVMLTHAGNALLRRASKLLLDVEDLLNAAQTLGDPLQGSLRLGVIPTIAPYLLPSISPALRRRFPKLTLLWVEDKTEVLLRQLAAGDLDAAILAIDDTTAHLHSEVIAKDDFVVAMPPSHELASLASPMPIKELSGEHVLLLDEGHCLRDQTLAVCQRGRANELEFRATSIGTLVQMVAAGAGMTLLPKLALATEAKRSKLVIRALAAPSPHRVIGLAWRKQAPMGAALAAVAAAMREQYPA
ncbi:MAG: LysR family transcriptional regulator [Myxococcales bacterium]|nr:LysR family transcriptional regulator [Myxococcales bacterium]